MGSRRPNCNSPAARPSKPGPPIPVLRALPLAFAQLADRSSRRVLLLSLLLSTLVLIALVVAVGWLLSGAAWFGIGWIDWTVQALGTLATLVIAWILFPGVLAAMTPLLVDPIVAAVEARYYPGLPPPRPQAWSDGAISGLRLAGLALVINLALLPFYIFLPGINLVLFYGANGYLLARGYFEQVAVRRLALSAARDLFGRHLLVLWVSGAMIAFMTTVPILNLVMPIVATALMTHLLEDLRAR
jgi:CysZ protein